jgi:hypothetical protein
MELGTSKTNVAKSSPWGKVAQPSTASASLSEIMSEQLAVDLHDKYVHSKPNAYDNLKSKLLSSCNNYI